MTSHDYMMSQYTVVISVTTCRRHDGHSLSLDPS